MLLCGCLPFDDDAARISSPHASRKFELRFPSWAQQLSPGAKDLLAKLLHVDPAKRATASAVSAHPWLRGDAAPPDAILRSPALLRDRVRSPAIAQRRGVPGRAGAADFAIRARDGRPEIRRKNSF